MWGRAFFGAALSRGDRTSDSNCDDNGVSSSDGGRGGGGKGDGNGISCGSYLSGCRPS